MNAQIQTPPLLSESKGQFRRDVRTLLLLVLALLGFARANAAGQAVSINYAYPIEQCSVAARDSFLITQFYGQQQDQTFSYSSSNTESGFTGTLSGTYQDQSVTINYSGDFTQYASTGVITWTSSGTFGSDAWSGGGSATFAPQKNGFNVSFDSSETSGPNSSTTQTEVTSTSPPNVVFSGTTGSPIVNGRPVGGWAHTMQVNPDGSCDSHYNPILNGASITAVNTPLFAIPSLSPTSPVILPISFNILPPPAPTPTLPQWAAIIMGSALVGLSMWKIRRLGARTT